ncbi:MAG TPA: hypothetical protein VED37_19675, partial [Ktedonobacteraceae bacterium]|nr:hypothetical protein [Ktedonobacteraceae bacterium]
MAQHLEIEKEHTTLTHLQARQGQIRLGIWIELIALFWMVIEASIAIVSGFAAHSVSLEGFGIDSIIELVAGSILLCRLLVEQRGG